MEIAREIFRMVLVMCAFALGCFLITFLIVGGCVLLAQVCLALSQGWEVFRSTTEDCKLKSSKGLSGRSTK